MLSREKCVFVVFHATTFLAGRPRSHATESHETFFAEHVKFVTLSHKLFLFFLAGVACDHFIADQALTFRHFRHTWTSVCHFGFSHVKLRTWKLNISRRGNVGENVDCHPSYVASIVLQVTVQKMYVHWPPSPFKLVVYSIPYRRYPCFSVLINGPSKWPSIKIDVPGRQGNDGGAIAGHAGTTGCSRHS